MAKIGVTQSPLQKKYNRLQKLKSAYCKKDSKVTKSAVNKAANAYKAAKIAKAKAEVRKKKGLTPSTKSYVKKAADAAKKQAELVIAKVVNRPCGTTSSTSSKKKSTTRKKSAGKAKIKSGGAIFTKQRVSSSKRAAVKYQRAIQNTGRRSIVRKTKDGYVVYAGPTRKRTVIKHTQQKVAGRRR